MPDDSDPQADSPDSGTASPPTSPTPSGVPGGGALATGGVGGLPPQGQPGAQENVPLGAQVNGTRRIQLAIKLIETTVPMFGSGTEEGKIVMDVLNKLSRKFGADGTRGQDPMDAVMRRQLLAQRAQPPAGPPGAGLPGGGGGLMPGMPPGGGGAPPGGPGPLPTPNRGPVPQPQVG